MKKNIVLFFISVFFCSSLMAQVSHSPYQVMFKQLLGTHIYQDQNHLFQDKIYGFDISCLKDLSFNKDQWIKESHMKSFGAEITFRDLSNLKGANDTAKNAFGQIYGLSLQAEFELFSIGNVKFNFRPSVGLGYTNKYYFNTPKNRIIGSPINELIKADLGSEIPLGQKTDLLAGVNFLHFSNGGATIPNGGLNTGYVYLGLKVKSNKETMQNRNSTYEPLRRNSFEMSAGLGKRGVFEQRHKNLFKSGFFAGYNYYLSDFISLKAGADAVYYYKIYDPDDNAGTFQYYGTSYEKWRAGLSIGADLNLWRITVNAQLGKYVYYKRLYDKASWYWTFGPTFNISNHIGIQAKTYMHFAQADFVNYGLLYRF